jgi:hypothetical protein
VLSSLRDTNKVGICLRITKDEELYQSSMRKQDMTCFKAVSQGVPVWAEKSHEKPL